MAFSITRVPRPGRGRWPRVANPLHLLTIPLIAAVALTAGCGGETSTESPGTGEGEDRAAPAAGESVSASSDVFERLKGRWLRPDGGYVVEITSIDAAGKAEAGYFNPRPIHVANALAVSEDGQLKFFMELKDAGYPGSTYKLDYKPDQDRLEGEYFQATLGETFQVVFVRMEE